MIATITPPTNRTVTITMTEKEARALFFLSLRDASVSDALRMAYGRQADDVWRFLTALRPVLEAVLVPTLP